MFIVRDSLLFFTFSVRYFTPYNKIGNLVWVRDTTWKYIFSLMCGQMVVNVIRLIITSFVVIIRDVSLTISGSSQTKFMIKQPSLVLMVIVRQAPKITASRV